MPTAKPAATNGRHRSRATTDGADVAVKRRAPKNGKPRLKLAATPKPRAKPQRKRGHLAQRQQPSAPSGDGTRDAAEGPLEDVRGVRPLHKEAEPQLYIWSMEQPAGENYRLLGMALAAKGGLFRNEIDGLGLVQVLPSQKVRYISKGPQLEPVLADLLPMQVQKDGKVVRELPTAAHLNAMLRSEKFLSNFLPVDWVTRLPVYLDDFSLARPGYNDCGPGHRILYLGHDPPIIRSTETIDKFLAVMDFASTADRTNAIAAALTVLLRHRWPGEKPVLLVTATLSQSGKGTITEFFRADVPKADILYESLDWPMQSQLQSQLAVEPDIGVVGFDNVRLDSSGGRGRFIRSAFVESFVTNAEVNLASPNVREPVRRKNNFVMTINTNDGALSPDLLNRSLSMHLAPTGDIQERQSPIGNPKLEFLPKNRERIEAELRGMIETWKDAGRPLDETVRHPMSPWAKTIGGILQANGYTDFLANYGVRRTTDDPVREALSILGAAQPGKELRPMKWADVAVEEGLAKTVFSPNERDTTQGRERAIGRLLKKNRGIVFEARADAKAMWYRLRLEGGFRRWDSSKNPYTQYVFTVLDQRRIPAEDEALLPPEESAERETTNLTAG